MKVRVSSHLHAYTDRQSQLEAQGATVFELLADLDRAHPGLRFRIIDEQDHIRQHMKIFVNQDEVRDLSARLDPSDTVQILGALSGG